MQHLTTSINSLTDLLRVNGTFAVSGTGSTYEYFMTALDPVAAALAPNMIVYDSDNAAVAAVQSGTITAFMSDYPTLQVIRLCYTAWVALLLSTCFATLHLLSLLCHSLLEMLPLLALALFTCIAIRMKATYYLLR